MTELRLCKVNTSLNHAPPYWVKSWFHRWTDSGLAIVEYEDGQVGLVEVYRVHFLDTKLINEELV